MPRMVGRYSVFQAAVTTAVSHIVERALEPSPRVAQHWESTAALTWFGGAADHSWQYVSWSFGRLREVPDLPGQRHTVGVFSVARQAFPGVDERELRALLDGLVPEGTDGATRVFLQRVTSQLAMGDALVGVRARVGCEVSLFARPDAVDNPASTSRWPEHARDRVAAALSGMDEVLRLRCERLWIAPSNVLLEAAVSALAV